MQSSNSSSQSKGSVASLQDLLYEIGASLSGTGSRAQSIPGTNNSLQRLLQPSSSNGRASNAWQSPGSELGYYYSDTGDSTGSAPPAAIRIQQKAVRSSTSSDGIGQYTQQQAPQWDINSSRNSSFNGGLPGGFCPSSNSSFNGNDHSNPAQQDCPAGQDTVSSPSIAEAFQNPDGNDFSTISSAAFASNKRSVSVPRLTAIAEESSSCTSTPTVTTARRSTTGGETGSGPTSSYQSGTGTACNSNPWTSGRSTAAATAAFITAGPVHTAFTDDVAVFSPPTKGQSSHDVHPKNTAAVAHSHVPDDPEGDRQLQIGAQHDSGSSGGSSSRTSRHTNQRAMHHRTDSPSVNHSPLCRASSSGSHHRTDSSHSSHGSSQVRSPDGQAVRSGAGALVPASPTAAELTAHLPDADPVDSWVTSQAALLPPSAWNVQQQQQAYADQTAANFRSLQQPLQQWRPNNDGLGTDISTGISAFPAGVVTAGTSVMGTASSVRSSAGRKPRSSLSGGPDSMRPSHVGGESADEQSLGGWQQQQQQGSSKRRASDASAAATSIRSSKSLISGSLQQENTVSSFQLQQGGSAAAGDAPPETPAFAGRARQATTSPWGLGDRTSTAGEVLQAAAQTQDQIGQQQQQQQHSRLLVEGPLWQQLTATCQQLQDQQKHLQQYDGAVMSEEGPTKALVIAPAQQLPDQHHALLAVLNPLEFVLWQQRQHQRTLLDRALHALTSLQADVDTLLMSNQSAVAEVAAAAEYRSLIHELQHQKQQLEQQSLTAQSTGFMQQVNGMNAYAAQQPEAETMQASSSGPGSIEAGWPRTNIQQSAGELQAPNLLLNTNTTHTAAQLTAPAMRPHAAAAAANEEGGGDVGFDEVDDFEAELRRLEASAPGRRLSAETLDMYCAAHGCWTEGGGKTAEENAADTSQQQQAQQQQQLDDATADVVQQGTVLQQLQRAPQQQQHNHCYHQQHQYRDEELVQQSHAEGTGFEDFEAQLLALEAAEPGRRMSGEAAAAAAQAAEAEAAAAPSEGAVNDSSYCTGQPPISGDTGCGERQQVQCYNHNGKAAGDITAVLDTAGLTPTAAATALSQQPADTAESAGDDFEAQLLAAELAAPGRRLSAETAAAVAAAEEEAYLDADAGNSNICQQSEAGRQQQHAEGPGAQQGIVGYEQPQGSLAQTHAGSTGDAAAAAEEEEPQGSSPGAVVGDPGKTGGPIEADSSVAETDDDDDQVDDFERELIALETAAAAAAAAASGMPVDARGSCNSSSSCAGSNSVAEDAAHGLLCEPMHCKGADMQLQQTEPTAATAGVSNDQKPAIHHPWDVGAAAAANNSPAAFAAASAAGDPVVAAAAVSSDGIGMFVGSTCGWTMPSEGVSPAPQLSTAAVAAPAVVVADDPVAVVAVVAVETAKAASSDQDDAESDDFEAMMRAQEAAARKAAGRSAAAAAGEEEESDDDERWWEQDEENKQQQWPQEPQQQQQQQREQDMVQEKAAEQHEEDGVGSTDVEQCLMAHEPLMTLQPAAAAPPTKAAARSSSSSLDVDDNVVSSQLLAPSSSSSSSSKGGCSTLLAVDGEVPLPQTADVGYLLEPLSSDGQAAILPCCGQQQQQQQLPQESVSTTSGVVNSKQRSTWDQGDDGSLSRQAPADVSSASTEKLCSWHSLSSGNGSNIAAAANAAGLNNRPGEISTRISSNNTKSAAGNSSVGSTGVGDDNSSSSSSSEGSSSGTCSATGTTSSGKSSAGRAAAGPSGPPTVAGQQQQQWQQSMQLVSVTNSNLEGKDASDQVAAASAQRAPVPAVDQKTEENFTADVQQHQQHLSVVGGSKTGQALRSAACKASARQFLPDSDADDDSAAAMTSPVQGLVCHTTSTWCAELPEDEALAHEYQQQQQQRSVIGSHPAVPRHLAGAASNTVTVCTDRSVLAGPRHEVAASSSKSNSCGGNRDDGGFRCSSSGAAAEFSQASLAALEEVELSAAAGAAAAAAALMAAEQAAQLARAESCCAGLCASQSDHSLSTTPVCTAAAAAAGGTPVIEQHRAAAAPDMDMAVAAINVNETPAAANVADKTGLLAPSSCPGQGAIPNAIRSPDAMLGHCKPDKGGQQQQQQVAGHIEASCSTNYNSSSSSMIGKSSPVHAEQHDQYETCQVPTAAVQQGQQHSCVQQKISDVGIPLAADSGHGNWHQAGCHHCHCYCSAQNIQHVAAAAANYCRCRQHKSHSSGAMWDGHAAACECHQQHGTAVTDTYSCRPATAPATACSFHGAAPGPHVDGQGGQQQDPWQVRHCLAQDISSTCSLNACSQSSSSSSSSSMLSDTDEPEANLCEDCKPQHMSCVQPLGALLELKGLKSFESAGVVEARGLPTSLVPPRMHHIHLNKCSMQHTTQQHVSGRCCTNPEQRGGRRVIKQLSRIDNGLDDIERLAEKDMQQQQELQDHLQHQRQQWQQLKQLEEKQWWAESGSSRGCQRQQQLWELNRCRAELFGRQIMLPGSATALKLCTGGEVSCSSSLQHSASDRLHSRCSTQWKASRQIKPMQPAATAGELCHLSNSDQQLPDLSQAPQFDHWMSPFKHSGSTRCTGFHEHDSSRSSVKRPYTAGHVHRLEHQNCGGLNNARTAAAAGGFTGVFNHIRGSCISLSHPHHSLRWAASSSSSSTAGSQGVPQQQGWTATPASFVKQSSRSLAVPADRGGMLLHSVDKYPAGLWREVVLECEQEAAEQALLMSEISGVAAETRVVSAALRSSWEVLL